MLMGVLNKGWDSIVCLCVWLHPILESPVGTIVDRTTPLAPLSQSFMIARCRGFCDKLEKICKLPDTGAYQQYN